MFNSLVQTCQKEAVNVPAETNFAAGDVLFETYNSCLVPRVGGGPKLKFHPFASYRTVDGGSGDNFYVILPI